MTQIYTLEAALQFEEVFNSREWTAVVPAAGRGSRLGMKDKPKILLELEGKTLLFRILRLLQDCCQRVVLVVNPHFQSMIQDEAERDFPGLCAFAVQEQPNGMADAVYHGKKFVNTVHTLVIWGDQVTFQSKTLKACMNLHSLEKASLTLPTIQVHRPYINFLRNSSGRIIKVEQAREGQISTGIGEADCGVFLFKTERLFSNIEKLKNNPDCIGRHTGELNLLPMIPYFEEAEGISTVRLENSKEAIGINTPEDVQTVKNILNSY